MQAVGMRPIVCMGRTTNWRAIRTAQYRIVIDGMRVTTEETMDVVEMVLGGLVNKGDCQLAQSGRWTCNGTDGKDGQFIRAKQ